MTARHASAARRERQAAAAVGGQRVIGERYTKRPDVAPIQLPSGQALIVEVKERAKLPILIARALDQARGYCAGAIPVAVIFRRGTRAGIACLPLDALALLLGLDVQALPKASPVRRGPRSPSQCELFSTDENKKR